MCIIIAILILLTYTITLIKIGGQVPPSLSASVFNLPTNKRWIWTVVLFAVCFLCVPTYIEKTSENTQFLAFLAIAGLAFVGAAPLVKFSDDEMQFRVHEIGAIICAVCSQLVLVFNNVWLLLAWIVYIGLFVWYTKDAGCNFNNWRTKIFWAEMICFINTFTYCLI